jgi:hypothetical protein
MMNKIIEKGQSMEKKILENVRLNKLVICQY